MNNESRNYRTELEKEIQSVLGSNYEFDPEGNRLLSDLVDHAASRVEASENPEKSLDEARVAVRSLVQRAMEQSRPDVGYEVQDSIPGDSLLLASRFLCPNIFIPWCD
jgi:hypothetical protein